MNRRQRRKQFKKVFGMNPEQHEKWVRGVLDGGLGLKTKAYDEALKDCLIRAGNAVINRK